MKKKNSKVSTEFTPSKMQMRFLETYLVSEENTLTAIAKEADVDRTTVYKWRRDPEFVKWFNAEVAAVMHSGLPDIWREVKRRAKKNHNDSELFMKRFDQDYIDKKIDLSGGLNNQTELTIKVVDVNGDEEEEE